MDEKYQVVSYDDELDSTNYNKALGNVDAQE